MTRTEVETFVCNSEIAKAWLAGEVVQVSVFDAEPLKWDDYTGTAPNFTNDNWQWRIKPKESELRALKRQLEAAIELQESGGMIAMTQKEHARFLEEFGRGAIVVGDFVVWRRDHDARL